MPNAKYFTKHPAFNSLVHLIGGIGIGALLAFPIFGMHIVRWRITLLVVAFIGHLYAWYSKK